MADREESSYIDFDLEIGKGDGRAYPVSARGPAVDATCQEMAFPYEATDLQKRLTELENALLRAAMLGRMAPSDELRTAQAFGQALFDALLCGEARRAYDASLALARQQEKNLRLRLRINAPELAALPWEFLYDPAHARFLSLSTETPLVRCPELPRPLQPMKVEPPLRILGMVASPRGLPELNVEQEKRYVEEALKELQRDGRVELTWLEGQTWRHLQAAMRKGPWHIFHFIGHGRFDEASDEGQLALADEDGNLRYISASQLALLLEGHRSLRLALLNACESGRGGRKDIYSSAASILVLKGLPAALAMQYRITDPAAVEFARAFYAALADGEPVDAAVVEGRKAICLEFPNTLEWAAPVLYLRAAGGVLFNPQRPVASTRKSPPVVQVSPISDLRSAIKNLQASITLPLAPGVTLPLVLVPKGQFIMGSDKAKDKDAFDDELPQHKLFLDDYYIGKYPVTVAQFAAFVKAEKYQTSAEKEGYGWVWKDNKLQKVEGAYWQQPRGPGSSVARKMDHTVTQVSWDDACDFCAWASRVCQVQVRLPSEAEWEKAARGTDGRIYPWGKEPPDASRCNFDLNVGDTTPVGRYSPLGDSPYGCADMLGNVWEWTSSRWGKQWDKTDFPYPYRAGDGREDPESRDWRVLRGGAFFNVSRHVRCAYRDWNFLGNFNWDLGFRVCLPHSP